MAKKAFEGSASAYGEEVYPDRFGGGEERLLPTGRMPRGDDSPAGAGQYNTNPDDWYEWTGGLLGSENKQGYVVNRSYFDPQSYWTADSVGPFERRMAGRAEGAMGLGEQDRNAARFGYGGGVRNEMLGRIRGYESQAELLQRAAIEQAQRSQLSMAGHAAPTARAAALRGASMGAAQSAQGIHLGARQHRLQEEMGMLGALGGVRGSDLKDELQRQAWELDKMRLRQGWHQMAQGWEGMAQGERQFDRGMGMRGEELQAQAHNAWLGVPTQNNRAAETFGKAFSSAGSLFSDGSSSSTKTGGE